jgi:serine/threonine-protein kinase HipA
MKIGSKYQFSEVRARHWEQFAEGVGFTKAQAKRRILELAKLLPVAARKLQSDPEYDFAVNAVVEQIITLIEQRCTLTIRRLTDPAAKNDAVADPAL